MTCYIFSCQCHNHADPNFYPDLENQRIISTYYPVKSIHNLSTIYYLLFAIYHLFVIHYLPFAIHQTKKDEEPFLHPIEPKPTRRPPSLGSGVTGQWEREDSDSCKHFPTGLLAPTGALIVLMFYYSISMVRAATFWDFEHPRAKNATKRGNNH